MANRLLVAEGNRVSPSPGNPANSHSRGQMKTDLRRKEVYMGGDWARDGSAARPQQGRSCAPSERMGRKRSFKSSYAYKVVPKKGCYYMTQALVMCCGAQWRMETEDRCCTI